MNTRLLSLATLVLVILAGGAAYWYFQTGGQSRDEKTMDQTVETNSEDEAAVVEVRKSPPVQEPVAQNVQKEVKVAASAPTDVPAVQLEPKPEPELAAAPPAQTTPPTKKSDRLVLYNIGINLGTYDPATGKAGDILFTNTIGDHYSNKALLEFGAELTGPSGTARMPHPTYFVPLGTKVFSPVDGTVENIRSQPESSDYEVVIAPAGYPSWRVSFDHVTSLAVKPGDTVRVGQIVAEVASSNSSAVPSNFGWFELQVWKESWGGPMDATCPFLLLADGAKQETAANIIKLAEDWEKFLGKDVYKQEQWVFPGCLLETTPA